MVKLIVMIMVIIIAIKPIINLALINTRELEKFEWLKLIPRNRDFSFEKKFFDKNILFCIINFTSSEKGGKFMTRILYILLLVVDFQEQFLC